MWKNNKMFIGKCLIQSQLLKIMLTFQEEKTKAYRIVTLIETAAVQGECSWTL